MGSGVGVGSGVFVAVGSGVFVGGTGVAVGTGVSVGGIGVAVSAGCCHRSWRIGFGSGGFFGRCFCRYGRR